MHTIASGGGLAPAPKTAAAAVVGVTEGKLTSQGGKNMQVKITSSYTSHTRSGCKYVGEGNLEAGVREGVVKAPDLVFYFLFRVPLS